MTEAPSVLTLMEVMSVNVNLATLEMDLFVQVSLPFVQKLGTL